MLALARKSDPGTLIRREVANYLHDAFSSEDGALGWMDRWTERRVIDQNMAKISLVLEADDPVECCYQDLIREIDTEAETGIYLLGRETHSSELRELAKDPGVSGKLHEHMDTIAPRIFPDELANSYLESDIVWVAIRARYDRAKVDATVSEIIMSHLTEDGRGGSDMSMALRSLMYSFHEDLARRISGLEPILDDRNNRELLTMINVLTERAGDYEERTEAIYEYAGSAK
jgi:hypothetical protein